MTLSVVAEPLGLAVTIDRSILEYQFCKQQESQKSNMVSVRTEESLVDCKRKTVLSGVREKNRVVTEWVKILCIYTYADTRIMSETGKKTDVLEETLT